MVVTVIDKHRRYTFAATKCTSTGEHLTIEHVRPGEQATFVSVFRWPVEVTCAAVDLVLASVRP